MKPDLTDARPDDARPEDSDAQAAMDTLLRVRWRGLPVEAQWARVAAGIRAERHTARRVWWLRTRPLSAAAALILAIVGLSLVRSPSAPPLGARIVAAAAAEQLRFGDGAVVATLLPGSEAVAGKGKPTGWVLDLARGEVLVKIVRKGTAFSVRTTAGEARALGTEYRVSLTPPGDRAVSAVMTVTVLTGAVEVSDKSEGRRIVKAGERASVQRQAHGYFVGVTEDQSGKPTLKWMIHNVWADRIGEANSPQALPIADPDAVKQAAAGLQPGDPIAIAIVSNRVVTVKPSSVEAVMADMREQQQECRAQVESARRMQEAARQRQGRGRQDSP